MTTQHPKQNAWTWTACGLLVLVIVTPALTQSLLSDREEFLISAASTDSITVAPAALVAAVLVYTAWRISAAASPAWILAALTLLGVKTVGLAGLQLTDPEITAAHQWSVTLIDTLQLALVVVAALVNRAPWFRCAPVVWGAAAGVLLGALRIVAVYRLPVVDPELALTGTMLVANLALAAAATWLVLHRGPTDVGIRLRLSGTVVLLVGSRIVETLDGGTRDVGPALLVVVSSVVGSALLVECGVSIVRQALQAQHEESISLEHKLVLAESEGRLQRARMHELESAVAGITSASGLLRDPGRVPLQRRAHLEEMIHAELGRLERLLRGGRLEEALLATRQVERPRHSPRPRRRAEADGFDLDRAIRTIAVAHRAKGTRVHWQPTGHRVRGHPDDVAEVLNILLDNAARHAGAEARVTVRETGDAVEILVSDTGPGVSAEVRDRLFQWGARDETSPGQGIGLHLAHQLMAQRGGYVHLDESRSAGATFVVGIPHTPVPPSPSGVRVGT